MIVSNIKSYNRRVKRNYVIRIKEILWGGIATFFGIVDLSTGIRKFFQRNNEFLFIGMMK